MNKLKDRDNHLYKRALSIKEASDYLCVSRGTIENWMSQGLLPYEEYPGRGSEDRRFRRIRLEDLESFLKGHYKRTQQTSKSNSITLLPANK